MVLLRQATLHDLPAVCRIDALVLGSTSRAHELQTAIAAGHCHVASLDMDIAGFAVMNQSFFSKALFTLSSYILGISIKESEKS